jgi:2-aminoadipate transaminase
MLCDRTVIQFTRGVPPSEAIPTRELAAHTAAVLEESYGAVFQYAPIGQFQGAPELREQLGFFHAVDPDRIFVGNGSLQVLDLLAAHLLRNGNPDVYVEAPTYDRAVQIFERHGGRVIGIPVEQDGLAIETLEKRLQARLPAFLYTIPDFQNPSGVTLSETKRRALVDLAARYGLTIVEDIPYRELRYHGAAPPLLAEIAGEVRVIVVASLSKVLSPGLRVGYAISDRETCLALAELAENTYLSPAPLCQAVAARCLRMGVVRSNIDRIRDLLRPRHDKAVAVTRRLLGEALLAVPDGGYFLGLHLRHNSDEGALAAAARSQGITLTRGSAFYPPSADPPVGTLFVRLPFQGLDPEDFADGLERLVKITDRIRH